MRRLRRATPAGLACWLVACAPASPPPALSAAAGADACTLDGAAPEVLAVADAEPSEWHGVFDLPDGPRLWEPAEPDGAIAGFREAVRGRLGADPDARSLLQRQREIFLAMPETWRGEAENSALLLEGRVGTIRPIGCLEAMLWKWQAARHPMLEHPTEFGAYVLRGNGRVRVYLSSADLVGQKVRGAVTQRVREDVQAGFRLAAHLHNHPFLFDRQVGDRMWTMEGTTDDVAGALAPSMTDVQFFRSLRDVHGLEEAWITNGLDTSRLRADELDALTGR
jgi:hypothetical protein